MTWRLARSLETLRAQINAMSPHRSKISDGTIGDAAHSSRTSDHNPDPDSVVRALDITHDPDHGVDSEALANALIASRDPRIKYIISNRKIASGAQGFKPWEWRKYSGANPHSHHVHISVVAGAAGDTTVSWSFPGAVDSGRARTPPSEPENPLLVKGDKGPDVKRMQGLLNKHGANLTADGDFGPKTEKAVKNFQRAHRLVADGKVGVYTWAALLA